MSEEKNVKPSVKRNVAFLLAPPGLFLLLCELPFQDTFPGLAPVGMLALLCSFFPAFGFSLSLSHKIKQAAVSYLIGWLLTLIWVIIFVNGWFSEVGGD